jgi:hypothetical protein
MTNRLTTAVGVLLLCAAGTTAHASSIIVNGSFELPPVANPIGYDTYGTGSLAIPGWTVIGPPNTEVAIVKGSFTSPPFSFPAEDGAQWLDLTGATSNSTEGVQQSVATSTFQKYILSFWIGNVSGGPFGTTSTVEVDVNGFPAAVLPNGSGTTTLTWQLFTLPIVAIGPSTTIAFKNLDPSTDNSNGLDNVSLEAVPEPATLLLLGTGTAALRLVRRRKGAAS